MGFPLMESKTQREVCLPELSGGINLRDSVFSVRENQLTDGINLWYKNAALTTRPGMRINTRVINGGRIDAFIRTPEPEKALSQSDIVPCRTDIYKMIDSRRYCLFAAKINKPGGDTLIFQFASDDAVINLPDYGETDRKIDNFFVTEHKQDLYCFLSAAGSGSGATGIVIRYHDGAWFEVPKKDCYVPLVLINGDMGHKSGSLSGTKYEDYNLLNGRYRIRYNADTCEADKVRYRVPRGVKSARRTLLEGETVTARFTDTYGGEVTHTVVISGQIPSVEEQTGSDGMRMRVWNENIDFVDERGENIALPEQYKGLRNNLELELPFSDDEFEKKKAKIFKMKSCIQYGGRFGPKGGERLFLCGNTEENDKNLVMWSEADNPLYFPENNYFYVGSSSQAVTGFGKQNKNLVLFKEWELFYTYCRQVGGRGGEDTLSNKTSGLSSDDFPLVQIHGSIGCDCPNTIQLCRNRLIWASTDGKVYTLANAGGNTERNVYEVSAMIERRLEKETPDALSAALSCDWQGYYCLFVGNHVYLMDYNSYGYQYAYSYSKIEDAGARIPWWYWELPKAGGVGRLEGVPHFVAVCGKKLLIYRMEEDDMQTNDGRTSFYCYYHIPYKIELSEKRDLTPEYKGGALRVTTEEREIHSMLQTGIFDFSKPQYRKEVSAVNIAFGMNSGEPISAVFITEKGEYRDKSFRLRKREADPYAPGHVQNVTLRPCTGFAALFGLRLECEGELTVYSPAYKYRITGGAG